MVVILAGCHSREGKIIDEAYRLSSSAPDSALALLETLNRKELDCGSEALYALVYTIAQDKCGLDVDNDSLIDIAYTYYYNRADDSLYAKCMYYTGKYYMLHDMPEKAIDLFKKATTAAKGQDDKYTMCLALNRMSAILSGIDPNRSVTTAREAALTYKTIAGAPRINNVYFKLDLCDALMLKDSLSAAKRECIEALKIAEVLGDSMAISACCQDLSNVLRKNKKYAEALYYSKKSFSYAQYPDDALYLNLAWAYLNADSLDRCDHILSNVRTQVPTTLYLIYYLKHLSSIKQQNYQAAEMFADSAYHSLEKMYGKEILKKEHYYANWSRSQYEKGVLKGKSQLYFYLSLVIAIAMLITIIALLYAYSQQRAKADAELRALEVQKGKQQAELRQKEEKMALKEKQISSMRDFILMKVATAQKLEKIKIASNKRIILSEYDWEEIIMFVNSIEDGFVSRLKKEYPDLTTDEVRFLVLIRAGMPAKALAQIYDVQEKSIRQKLFVYKNKFHIGGENTSLRKYIETF